MRPAIGLLLAAAAFAQEYVVEGDSTSAVRVIAYEDLQCPDCAVYRKMLDEKLLPKYGKSVAFEHREFPLAKHKWARPAAIAARYFGSIKPETGIVFRRYCSDHFLDITPENFAETVKKFAAANGADPAAAVAALDDKRLAKIVEDEFQEGVARGVARTPTVFVNGEPFIENFTFEQISKSIDAALATLIQKTTKK